MWNRFWMLISTIWLGFCVYVFITTRRVGGIDYDALADQARQEGRQQPASAADKFDADKFMAQRYGWKVPAGSTLVETERGTYLIPPSTLTGAEPAVSKSGGSPVSIRHSYQIEWLWLGPIGYVLWLIGRFVRYGFRMRPVPKEPQK